MRHVSLRLLPLAALGVLFPSCLTEDDDKFAESASERMRSFLAETRRTLTSAEHGWAMDYYPQEGQGLGGYAFTLRFSGDSVSVRFELDTSGREQTTLYSLKGDMGPVLSFDSYLRLFHFFATPASGLYQGYEGDFEFVIDSVGADLVKMHGKRTGNVITLSRLSGDAADYASRVAATDAAFDLVGADLLVGGAWARVSFDLTARGAHDRHLTIVSATDSVRSAYVVTDAGLRLYRPIAVNGTTVWALAYDPATLSLSAEGVETVRPYVNPAAVVNTLADMGFANDGGTRPFGVGAYLAQFDFVADADWLTTSASGGTLTVSASPNASGQVRRATLSVRYAGTDIEVATYAVRQYDLSDVLGGYSLRFTDIEGNRQTLPATLGQDDDGQAYIAIALSDSRTVRSDVSFDASTRAVVVRGGLNGAQENGVDLWNAIIFADGDVGTGSSTLISALFDRDAATGVITAQFVGTWFSYALTGWLITPANGSRADLRNSRIIVYMDYPSLTKT